MTSVQKKSTLKFAEKNMDELYDEYNPRDPRDPILVCENLRRILINTLPQEILSKFANSLVRVVGFLYPRKKAINYRAESKVEHSNQPPFFRQNDLFCVNSDRN